MPQSKVDKLQEIRRECNKKIAFVGDGLNDAGAIAVCDVGIAMAKHGNDITTENADVVVLGDEPKNIIVAHKACKKTCKKVKVNLFVALLTKFAFLVFAKSTKRPVKPSTFTLGKSFVTRFISSMRSSIVNNGDVFELFERIPT